MKCVKTPTKMRRDYTGCIVVVRVFGKGELVRFHWENETRSNARFALTGVLREAAIFHASSAHFTY